jgi:hypothetical protein
MPAPCVPKSLSLSTAMTVLSGTLDEPTHRPKNARDQSKRHAAYSSRLFRVLFKIFTLDQIRNAPQL